MRPSCRPEPPAHDRLLKLLIAAWETVQPGSWKPAVLDKLLTDADWAGKGLDTWLREKFFEQHAKRFHHRPFIWHVWDGLKDGFAALVNYHKLLRTQLENTVKAARDVAEVAATAALAQLAVGEGKSAEWTALVPDHVENADELKNGLRQLHKAFTQAPILGSLLDTGKSSGDLFTADYKLLSSLLQQALKAEQQPDLLEDSSATWNNALTALGLLDAARLLADRYNLVITNVPYLARGKQNDTLKDYCETH